MKQFIYIVFLILPMACNHSEPESDAFGNFTATEILVTAQTSGILVSKSIDEGTSVEKGMQAYVIDTVQTYLKKQELLSGIRGIQAKRANVNAQLAVLQEQERTLLKEQKRFGSLVADGAAPQKQLDDIESQLKLVRRQMEQVQTNFMVIDAEMATINVSLKQLSDLLSRSYVTSPISGVVIETYFEQGEAVGVGRPLFKVANLDTMELKAYFSGTQLGSVKIGGRVTVLTDDEKGGLKEYPGTITWISKQAEFTPKIIQTREERVSLVYAVKIKVPNDGSIHMNMPGEVRLLSGNQE